MSWKKILHLICLDNGKTFTLVFLHNSVCVWAWQTRLNKSLMRTKRNKTNGCEFVCVFGLERVN